MDAVLHLFRLAASACGTRTGILPSLYDPPVQCGSDGVGGQTIVLTSVQDLLAIIGNVVRIVLALGGGVAIIAVLIASIYYVASAGDPARIKRAKDILMNMAIGLVVMISAYAVVTYIAKGF